jgi:hypothetical protein
MRANVGCFWADKILPLRMEIYFLKYLFFNFSTGMLTFQYLHVHHSPPKTAIMNVY